MNPSRRDQRWLTVAARVAAQSDCTQKVGAVLVVGGRPVAARPNRMRHNPALNPQGPCSIHAEMNAITSVGGRTRGGTVYVARLLRRTMFGEARPCPTCITGLIDAGVGRVVWTTATGSDQARPRIMTREEDRVGRPAPE